MYRKFQPQMDKSVADFAYDCFKEGQDTTAAESNSTIADGGKSKHKCDQCVYKTDNVRAFQLHVFGHQLGQDITKLLEDTKITIKQENGDLVS